MGSKFDEQIDEMKQKAKRDVLFRKVLEGQHDVVIVAANAIVEVIEDIPEGSRIKKHLMTSVMEMGKAAKLLNIGMEYIDGKRE